MKNIVIDGIMNDYYLADEYGNVYNIEGKRMTPHRSYNGYDRIKLSRGLKRGMYLLHRIVAETFLTNIDNLPIVLHKNNIRHDCRVSNLKWGTNSENQKQRFESYPPTKMSPVRQLDLVTRQTIAEYSTITEAFEATGIFNISAVRRGVRPKAGNYYWEFI